MGFLVSRGIIIYKMKEPKRLLTAAQAKALDQKALTQFGISTLVLMENAGRAVAEETLKVLKSRRDQLALFCGMGNNGGDGLCAARHLLVAGLQPQVYLVGKIKDVKSEAKVNLDMLLELKQKITEINSDNINYIRNKIVALRLIIDALLGVGVKGELRPLYQQLIDMINISTVPVLSVDIPSGLDATTGRILGCCIKADRTVTFVAKKRGMVYGEGKQYCGKVLVRAIGLPSISLF